ncbi:MAG TPA: AAA family ATPase [Gammaproteobacteria bacterium]|nr:AAA family ATPase [Gammaproteobacteria bacterium]
MQEQFAAARRAKSPAPRSLPEALRDPRCYGPGVDEVRLAETHISWVFLTGRYAYKVKKPVKLPFVDFSTLKLRKRFCDEELRVNRRFAPELYRRVVPIGGTPAAPRLGRTPAFEYAVQMLEFPSDARLDRSLAANRVPRAAFGELGARLAELHAHLPRVRRVAVDEIGATALRNVDELEAMSQADRQALASLRAWTRRQIARLDPVFARRAAAGAYRECHGDLHLQNLVWRDDKIVAFDALEFDRKLRDIDVISEIAFLAMDLHAHDRADLASEVLSRYLEVSGDYGGVDVLPFYLVYRALVRAKVAAIKRAQSAADGHEAERYLATAIDLAAPRVPLLVITHGLSGSGKTTVTDELVSGLPAVRARSDLERKRLHGLGPTARSGSGLGTGLYAANASQKTYAALAEIADALLRNGQNALIDAAFLDRRDRLRFRQVAAANAARFAILDCTASPAELRRRIVARSAKGRDASEADLAVLERQLSLAEPFDRAERRHAVTVDTERDIRFAELAARLRRV